MTMNVIQQKLLTELRKSMSQNPSQMINNLMAICDSYYTTPVHNLQDLKMRNKKVKGDIFEYFTQLYLQKCYGLEEVWLLSEIPDSIKTQLNLSNRDVGIDLVARDRDGKFYAIQSKFRKRNKSVVVLTWKQLSTFYALCARTGPFEKYIVFTTADYVRRIGKKTSKDITIGYNRLKNMSHFEWLKIVSEDQVSSPQEESQSVPKTITQSTQNSNQQREEFRKKRLQYYDSKETQGLA